MVSNARAIAMLLALPFLAAPAQPPERRADAGDARQAADSRKPGEQEDRTLYVRYGCYQCHGYEAQGSSATGPRLGPPALPYEAFARYVRQPAGQMPPYTTRVLSDAELQKIYAYVQSRPAPAPLDRIPLLSK